MRHHEGSSTNCKGPRRRAVWMVRAGLPAAILWPVVAAAQPATSGSAIVQDALKDVQQDQAEDARKVRRMIDEAVKGAERAPSGEEAINPPAPGVLQPMQADVPGALPPGIRREDLAGKPLRDGAGTEIGRVRDLVLDQASGSARVVVELAPLFGYPAKTTVLEIEALQPAESKGDGYIVELTPVEYEAMPRYAWKDGAWRQENS